MATEEEIREMIEKVNRGDIIRFEGTGYGEAYLIVDHVDLKEDRIYGNIVIPYNPGSPYFHKKSLSDLIRENPSLARGWATKLSPNK